MYCLKYFQKDMVLRRYSIDSMVKSIWLILTALLLLSTHLKAVTITTDSMQRPIIKIPHNLTLQHAGNTGLIAPGLGYNYAKGFKIELFGTYIPKQILGNSVFLIAGKNTYNPLQILIGNKYKISPVIVGFMISHTFGNDFFITTRNKSYSYGYYDFSTAIRMAILYQFQLSYDFLIDSTKPFKGISIYWEIGLHDLDVPMLFYNKEVTLYEAITFAIGLRIKLREGS